MFDSLSSLPFFDIRTHAVILFNFQVFVGFDIRQTYTKFTVLSLNKVHAKGLRHT